MTIFPKVLIFLQNTPKNGLPGDFVFLQIQGDFVLAHIALGKSTVTN